VQGRGIGSGNPQTRASLRLRILPAVPLSEGPGRASMPSGRRSTRDPKWWLIRPRTAVSHCRSAAGACWSGAHLTCTKLHALTPSAGGRTGTHKGQFHPRHSSVRRRPCSVVNHAASIPCSLLRFLTTVNEAAGGTEPNCRAA
jgi:hypothetical protein